MDIQLIYADLLAFSITDLQTLARYFKVQDQSLDQLQKKYHGAKEHKCLVMIAVMIAIL